MKKFLAALFLVTLLCAMLVSTAAAQKASAPNTFVEQWQGRSAH